MNREPKDLAITSDARASATASHTHTAYARLFDHEGVGHIAHAHTRQLPFLPGQLGLLFDGQKETLTSSLYTSTEIPRVAIGLHRVQAHGKRDLFNLYSIPFDLNSFQFI